jgi:TrmH family RNA methyltransferase
MEYLSKAEQARIRALDKRKVREEQGRCIAEGIKICAELLASNHHIHFVVISDDASQAAVSLAQQFEEAGIEVFGAGSTAFERMSDAQHPQGIFAIVELPESSKESPSRFLALEDVNDPGNIGTIMRTADWFGVKDVVLGGNCADPYSPKTIRASMGSVFRMNIHIAHALPSFLNDWKSENRKGEVYGLIVDCEHTLHEVKQIPSEWGLIMGSESHGLTKETIACITKPVRIDGNGKAESLNVGIASGIALYHCTNIASKQ